MRVIAGTLGGRRLEAPKGRNTRPTSDRVRESLFMQLEPLADLRVVDLFAGSGALGIEALSRGAASVDFVESAASARRVLERNLETLGLGGRAVVWPFELPQGLKRLSSVLERADLVLLDPPYGGVEARGTLTALSRAALGGGVRVIIEHHLKDLIPDRAGTLARTGQRRYGETVISTYRIGVMDVPPPAEEEGDD